MDVNEHIQQCNERREYERREQDKVSAELRDRMVRAEQDIKNHKENFQAFKADDFGDLKKEVHTMRNELNVKMDIISVQISKINITMAKWLGMGTAVLFVVEIAVKVIWK